VNRVQRDFPVANEKNQGLGFTSPTIKTNLHQMITDRMKKHGLKCYDIRSREIKNEIMDLNKAELYIRKYEANGGTEYFISFEIPKTDKDWDDAYLLGLLRLRLSDDMESSYLLKTFQEKVAKIREVHVYGFVSGNKENNVVQHRGIGKALLKVAETIALSEGYKKIAVISGVGVRKYYKNQGYIQNSVDGDYLIKELKGYYRKIRLFNFEYDYENIIYKLSLRSVKDYNAGNGKLYIMEKDDNLLGLKIFLLIAVGIVVYLSWVITLLNY
jgi:histone acetyltransferase (RNA polymerase elongator complex component)